MRSVPANPTESKPLPPVPANESSSRSASGKRSSSIYSRAINSWEAPASWRSSSNEPSPQSTTIYLQPTTFSSGDSQSPDVNHSLPPVSEPRTYSPILPDPSPDPTEPNIELGATLPSKPSSVNQSKPTTMPEGVHSDLSASRAPPQSSLLPPLVNIAPESPAKPLPPSPSPELPVANLKKIDSKIQAMQVHPITSPQPVPSTSSIPSKPPLLRNFPPYKAAVSLGLEKASSPPIPERNVTRSRQTPPRTRDYTHYIQTERRFTPGQAQGAKNKENVTDNDSSEDEDMNYHSVLVEQYRGLAVHDHHADKKGRTREGRHHDFVRDPELIPHPLSWQKASSGEQHSNENGNGVIEKTNERTTSRRESLFKMPLHLSLTNKVQKESPSGGFRILLPQCQETISSASGKSSKSGIGVRKPSRCQPASPDHRFSAFYPRAKPLTSARKQNKKGKQKAAYVPPLPLVLPTALASSPRTTEPAPHPHFALQEPRISLMSILQASSSPQHSSSYPASMERGARTPLPSPTHSHSHSHSRKTSLPSPTPKALANAHNAYNKLRASLGSLSALSHVHSTTPPSPQRPPFVHERPTNPARADPTLPPPPPQLQPWLSPWRIAHPDADADPEERKPGFLAKALEARRRRSREVRLLKLKRSIRVLGPTDPREVEGFEGRRPGYLGEP